MIGPERPGDVEQARAVDVARQQDAQRLDADQARRDAERVYLVTVTNSRTGAQVTHNSRDDGGFYITADGMFLMLPNDVERVLSAWKAANEDIVDQSTITGRQMRLAKERAAKP